MVIGLENEQAREILRGLERLGVPSITQVVPDPRGSYTRIEIPDDTFTRIADNWFGKGKSLTIQHGGHPSGFVTGEEAESILRATRGES